MGQSCCNSDRQAVLVSSLPEDKASVLAQASSCSSLAEVEAWPWCRIMFSPSLPEGKSLPLTPGGQGTLVPDTGVLPFTNGRQREVALTILSISKTFFFIVASPESSIRLRDR